MISFAGMKSYLGAKEKMTVLPVSCSADMNLAESSDRLSRGIAAVSRSWCFRGGINCSERNLGTDDTITPSVVNYSYSRIDKLN
jgi:hypothetical protein